MRFARRTAMLFVALMTTGASLVVLTAGPAAAATVSDEAGFRGAWGDPNEQQIDLAADITLTCPGGEALRNSSTPIAVNGHGHTVRQTCAGQRVLEQVGSAAITFDGVTITGGTTPAGANGGGIRAPGGGTVTVANSTVMGNTAGGSGGGVAAAGAVGVTNSTISGNVATGNGAGVGASGTVTVTNSTISDNVVGGTGGGIAQGTGAAITIRKSTISGNVLFFANGGASAVAGSTGGAVTLTNSTISGNSSGPNVVAISAGGAVTAVYTTAADIGTNFRLFPNGSLTSFGSVVAGCFVDPTTTTSNGHNFSYDSSCGFTNTAQGDQQNAGDPGLGALADNGGPTQTRLPQPGSPLIDAIPTASCQADGASGVTADQRGMTRPQGAACDIGAVDTQAPSNHPPVVHAAAPDTNGTEGDILSTSGSFTDPDGDPLTITANNAAGTITDNGDGTWSGSLATNDDVAPATVTVTATDPDGATATDNFGASAVNADPVVAATTVSPTSACSVSVSAAFSDAGTGDTHAGTIGWGDASNDAANISENSGAGTATGAHTHASPGTFTVGVTVTDDDGGSGSNSGTFTTLNTPSGILPPINADGTGNFKLGSAIPVKITVKDCGGNIVSTLAPTVSLAKTGPTSGEVNEPISSSVADTGNTMRWDPTASQYVFNLSTKRSQFNAGQDLPAGRYRLQVSDPTFTIPGYVEAFFDLKD
jgi:Bacterial Ig domain/Putative pectate lyase-like adhesive domain